MKSLNKIKHLLQINNNNKIWHSDYSMIGQILTVFLTKYKRVKLLSFVKIQKEANKKVKILILKNKTNLN